LGEAWTLRAAPVLEYLVGSLAELSYTLRLSRDRNLLSDADWKTLEDLRGTAGSIVWRLYRSLNGRPPGAQDG
jgi:hypothetical protein